MAVIMLLGAGSIWITNFETSTKRGVGNEDAIEWSKESCWFKKFFYAEDNSKCSKSKNRQYNQMRRNLRGTATIRLCNLMKVSLRN